VTVLVLGLGVLVLAGVWVVGRGVGGVGAGLIGRLRGATTAPERFVVQGPTINQVQALNLLTVQSVQVVSEMEAEAAFRKGTWIVRGSADYVVDFSRAKLVERDEQAKVVTISLPQPELRSPRLDEQRTRLVTLENTGIGWWTIGMAGSRDIFEKTSRTQMQLAVVRAARDEQFVSLARLSGERLVASIFELAGWRVRIEWRVGE
jgi:hypothetical protein